MIAGNVVHLAELIRSDSIRRMGQEIKNTVFSDEDYALFRQLLEKETALLTSWFDEGALSNEGLMGGFEIESWLLNEFLQPAPVNQEFLNQFNSDLATPELAKFNLEFNNTPQNLSDTALSDFHHEFNCTWKHAEDVASGLSRPTSILLIGTLPTLNISDLNEYSMSDMNRYRALNSEIMDRRKKKPLHLYIHGDEQLDLYSHDVMLEASTTSFQIHTKVPANDAHHYYNASIIVSAPMVSIAANSPFVFGKNLWSETRIPLFEQSIDTDNPDAPCKRVSFGTGFAKESILECFQENLDSFHILLPIINQNNSDLSHLRLHNGTIWRWNRPLIGFSDSGEAHVRIEHRAIAAGPSIIDMMANAAFFYGLQQYWAQRLKQGHALPAFEEAKNNFYIAATGDLKSLIHWYGKPVNLKTLLYEELLAQSESGLKDLQICSKDINKYLKVIEERIVSEQTGASWQRKYVSTHNCDMAELTQAYQALQQTHQPIHSWNVDRTVTPVRQKGQLLELKQLESFPKELLDIRAEELYTIFPQPTLLHLKGMNSQVVFISVLLHGNEPTGFYVVQELLRKYEHTRLPKSVSIFFGNTQAARHKLRLLDTQHDYNRVWPGTKFPHAPEARIMFEITEEMKRRDLFASIDIHNNTGLNPHYACINKLDNAFLHLATLFGPTVVYFIRPIGVQSMAFSKICPSVTLECGKISSRAGTNHALEFVDGVVNMRNFPTHKIASQDIHLFHTIARVKVPENITFSFTDKNADILFNNELDKMNFAETPPKTSFGKIRSNSDARLLAFNDHDEEIGNEIFHIAEDRILLNQSMMPAMLTLDEDVIRQDCLCYLMERIPSPD